MVKLVLVLGDQLTPEVAALKAADKGTDVVVMAEVRDEASYVPHHPKKIAFLFAAMRKFAAALEADGWTVAYTRYDDPDNAGSIPGELLRRAEEHGASEVIATEPGEHRLIALLDEQPLTVRQIEDDRFLCSHRDFAAWAEGRKELRMEWFYREMRRKTGLLMEKDKPAGGQWNFDHDNRKPADADMFRDGPPVFEPDDVTEEVLDLVAQHFPDNFGTLRPFRYATDRDGARKALAHFVKHRLARFGEEQDAMLAGDAFLSHAVLSPYLNAGLLTPMEICQAVAAAYQAGDVPINAAEGFIRQVIGWREYVRGIYFLEGPGYAERNILRHDRTLPGFFWTGGTDMACMSHAIGQTREHGYAHHIQRLMVIGNFALLAGLDPQEVQRWFMLAFVDAYEWVMSANVIGMSQWADGGIVGSKPYVSSGSYIDRMSDYCGDCRYKVKDKTGADACPFNLLYWGFLDRHRQRFEKLPRMAVIYRSWDRMDAERRREVLKGAEDFLGRLEAGERV